MVWASIMPDQSPLRKPAVYSMVSLCNTAVLAAEAVAELSTRDTIASSTWLN